MGLILLFRGATVAPQLKSGYAVAGLVGAGVVANTYIRRGYATVGTKGVGTRQDTAVSTSSARYPTVSYQVAFTSQPLSTSPAWVDLSTRLRRIEAKRGRSYEFDRMETGTNGAALDNRDSALSPENSSSTYNPIRSTRPVRATLSWLVAYPMFRGISEGFPQTYQSFGADSLVNLNASDLFYALNNSRFTPGSTTLTNAMLEVAESTEETITVGSTAAPMPQNVPFTITIAGESTLVAETVTVTEIVSSTEYLVTRAAGTTTPANPHHAIPYAHSAGVAITTAVVDFPEALSGERIRQVLEAVGFTSAWYDLDAGQSLISPSEDLASVAPLEHISLIADAEFGRFFVSKDGKFTFRDRHSVILDNLSAVFTFTDGAVTASGEVPFVLDGELSHSEEKLFNRVRITIQGGDYDAQIVDVSDSSSIDEHFERVFERTFPYADHNDADSAAQFVLARNSEAQLRLPGISVRGAVDPTNLWPRLLAREIGDRVRFRYQPQGGGTEIDQDLAIDGISHQIVPGDHVMTFQCTEVDSNNYWILGLAGYSELSETTRVGF